mgnify:CR=1 FL=1
MIMSARHPRHRVSTRWSLSLLCLVLLALAGNALAASLNLAWDGVVGASGYRLAYGTTSGNYSASLDAGNKTTCPPSSGLPLGSPSSSTRPSSVTKR